MKTQIQPIETIGNTIRSTNSKEEEARAVSVLVSAFETDPAIRWLWPHDKFYTRNFSEFVHAFAGGSFAEGTAYVTMEFTGAALWHAPGFINDDTPVIDAIQKSVLPDRLDDAFELFGKMEDCHPKFPHWYLPLIGVDPSHQGMGEGSRLLRHTLRNCDRNRIPAYLEASSPASVPLYERHGFRKISELQAGSSPVIYPMLRDPK